MKTIKPFQLVAQLFIIAVCSDGYAQTGKLILREIVHGRNGVGKILPEKIEVNSKQGIIEFKVPQNKSCAGSVRVTYKFLQDMQALEMTPEAEHRYAYEVKIEPLDKPCYAVDHYLFRNPSLRAATDAAGSYSALKNNKITDKTWKYNPDVDFIGERSPIIVAYQKSPGDVTGAYSGEFKTLKLNTNYLKSGKQHFTGFYFLINGTSALGYEDSFSYEVYFVYELVDGSQKASVDPCEIKEPDCSCCPGTIPVWNFQTNKGECMCPEGQIWDRVAGKCVPIKN